MIRRVLAVVAIGGAVAVAPASEALAAYPPNAQQGTVSATVVSSGGTVTFAGNGFAAGSTVTVDLNGALYATVKAAGSATAMGSSAAHVATAAFVRPVAHQAAAAGSFSIQVQLQKSGTNVLSGSGVDPDGAPRTVTATVSVQADTATTTVTKGGTLPFTGSDVLVPGAIVGASMLGGGFLLLTSVRSRKAGARG